MATQIASRKAKARNLQYFIRDLILAHFPLLPDDVVSTPMGAPGIDIRLSPKARKHFNFDVEAKNDENKSIWFCWEKTIAKKLQATPLLFMKKNHHEPLAIMRARDFMGILEKLDRLINPEDYYDVQRALQQDNEVGIRISSASGEDRGIGENIN